MHTRLIPASWLEFRKEGGSVACRGQRPRKRKSSMLWAVSAKRVWLSLDWLNSSSSGLLADASERWLKRWTRREGGDVSLPLYPTLLADPRYEGRGTNGRPGARCISFLRKMRDARHRVTPARVRKHRITQREAVMAFADCCVVRRMWYRQRDKRR